MQSSLSLGFIFITKLSKKDKIEICHLWHDYQVGLAELSQRYRVGRSNIDYLLALIDCHGLAILDQTYTQEFREKSIKQALFGTKSIVQVSLDLGLRSSDMLNNLLRKYKENGYYVIIKPNGRPAHGQEKELSRRQLQQKI